MVASLFRKQYELSDNADYIVAWFQVTQGHLLFLEYLQFIPKDDSGLLWDLIKEYADEWVAGVCSQALVTGR